MVRNLVVPVFLLVCMGTLHAANPKPAYEILPAATQAVVLVRDSDVLVNGWNRTQLSKLADLADIRDFWKNQQEQIENKLTSAGWRLHIQPRDLGDVVSGQLALAWIERREDVQKPFSLVLIVDVINKQKETEDFLKKLDNQLKERGAKRNQLQHAGVNIAQHTLPRQNGELLPQNTFYAVVNEQLLASDDLGTLQGLIDAASGSGAGSKLNNDEVFQSARKQAGITSEAAIEYFARPLGFARVLRAISGKRNSKADILAVLQSQGFDTLKGVCGEVRFGEKDYDMVHRGYLLAEGSLKQRPQSVQVLDFPNEAGNEVPSFVSNRVSSLMSSCWNVREAFWKTETLVDKIADQPKVFENIIEGIRVDPTGPRIDIRNEVMPLMTNEIYSISDARLPIDTDSRRNLIAVRIKSPEKFAKILDRAMETEVDAELVDVKGQKIWQVAHKEDDLELDLDQSFGALPNAAPANKPNDPLLNNWAVTVYGDYLMFSSHKEMISEAIEQAKQGSQSPLMGEPDYQSISSALRKEFGEKPGCAWRINRSALAYRPQYELFRAGKLQDSESMIAKFLEHLVQNKSELQEQPKKATVDGSSLPAFEKISQYLLPSGTFVQTTDNGWRFGSLLLSKDAVIGQAAPARAAGQAENAAAKPGQTATNR